MVRADSVLGVGKELASARDDADADQSLPSSSVQLQVVHAVQPSH